MKNEGFIFNIQRFSVHDGPGIRSTIFLKGCSLHCFWCHNPEGLKFKPEVQFDISKCIYCSECLNICKNSAHENINGFHTYYREKCVICGECIESCYSGSLELIGKKITVDEIMKEILQDVAYYKSSGGGITLSGGEPVLQHDFTLEILKRCKEENLNTAIETSGNYQWEELNSLLEFTDIVMMDLKSLDSDKHKNATGSGNEKILLNAAKLTQTEKPVIFRTPVIPTVNDSPEEITEICKFIKNLADERTARNNGKGDSNILYELLPFHQLASDKYRSLGVDYRAAGLEAIPPEKMNGLITLAKSFKF